MEDLKDILVKQFTDDIVSPNLKSFTDYEEELKVTVEAEKAKTEKYENIKNIETCILGIANRFLGEFGHGVDLYDF